MNSCLDLNNYLITQRPYTNIENNFFLFNCLFMRVSMYNGNGGVISIENILCNMEILESSFFSCSSTGTGGSIYFTSSNISSKSLLKKICGLYCFALNYNFGLISISSSLNTNSIYDSTLSYCLTTNINYGNSILLLFFGNQTTSNLNTSNNYGKIRSGFSKGLPNLDFGSFLTIYNNTTPTQMCIDINSISTCQYIFTNIIKNNGPQFGVILNQNDGQKYFSNFIFYDNSNYLFVNLGNNPIILSNCYIFHTNTSIFSGPYSFSTKVFTSYITNSYIFTHFICAYIKITFFSIPFFKNQIKFFKFFLLIIQL